MPRSVPNVELLTPAGLQLLYRQLGFGAVSVGTGWVASPPAVISSIRGGTYLALTGGSGQMKAGAGNPAATSWFDFDGVTPLGQQSQPFIGAPGIEHRGIIQGGQSFLPIVPGDNIAHFGIGGIQNMDVNDSWLVSLIPNVHGNHRVINYTGPPVEAPATISVDFEIGQPGPYVMLCCASGMSANVADRSCVFSIDGVPLSGAQNTIHHFFNRAADFHAFCPFPTSPQNLSSGNHTLTVGVVGGTGTFTGPFSVLMYWDPHGLTRVTGSNDIFRPGVGSWNPTFAAGLNYTVLGGFTGYSATGNQVKGIQMNTKGGGLLTGGVNIEINPANVHTYVGWRWSGGGSLANGDNAFFWSDGDNTAAFSFQSDGNDHSWFFAFPTDYIG